jgi:nucleotide-binding universal stress UspA family protein
VRYEILTVYDGTLHSKIALKYGIGKVKEKGGELIVLQVFQSNLFVDYDAGPRAEEIARNEAARHARDAQQIIAETGSGTLVHFVSEEGNPEQEILRSAASERPDLILASPRFKAIAKPRPVRVSDARHHPGSC